MIHGFAQGSKHLLTAWNADNKMSNDSADNLVHTITNSPIK